MNAMILAQQIAPRAERLRGIQTRFSNVDPSAMWQTLLVLVMLAALVMLVWMVYRIQRRRGNVREQSPMGLFWKVLAGLGLPLWDRIRLWHAARELQIQHPTALLISADLFDQAAKRYLRGEGVIRRSTGAARQFAALREQLFGRSAE